MNIETTLRESLHAHSAEAPTNPGLLGAVEDRSSRRRQRRQVASVGIAVTVTLVGALSAPAVVGAVGNGPEAPTAPATQQPPLGRSEPDTLVAPSYEVAMFPFTPGWVPQGYGEPHYVQRSGTLELRHFPSGEPVSFGSAGPYIAVTIRSEDSVDLGFDWDITEEAVTVRGHEAVLYTGHTDESVPEEVADASSAVVIWAESPGQWVTVRGINGFSSDDVMRYAEGLAVLPVPGEEPFTFELLPPDLELRSMTSDEMSFTPVGEAREEEPSGSLYIVLIGPDAELVCSYNRQTGDVEFCPTTGREPVQVGERDGEFIDDEHLLVFLDDDLDLLVRARGELALSREDLIRVAAGIQLTSYARLVG